MGTEIERDHNGSVQLSLYFSHILEGRPNTSSLISSLITSGCKLFKKFMYKLGVGESGLEFGTCIFLQGEKNLGKIELGVQA